MLPAKLSKFLVSHGVKYEEIKHRQVFTGLDKAATLGIKPNLVVKTLVLRSGKNLVMAVLAANRNLNRQKLSKKAKLKNLDFVSEKVMKSRFKGFKVGALPPFGQLFKIPSFIDAGLLKEKVIYVSAGNYETSLKISPAALEKLGAAKAGFSEAKKTAKPKKKKK
jgi:Ala-tRNA(Pro) deacylase